MTRRKGAKKTSLCQTSPDLDLSPALSPPSLAFLIRSPHFLSPPSRLPNRDPTPGQPEVFSFTHPRAPLCPLPTLKNRDTKKGKRHPKAGDPEIAPATQPASALFCKSPKEAKARTWAAMQLARVGSRRVGFDPRSWLALGGFLVGAGRRCRRANATCLLVRRVLRRRRRRRAFHETQHERGMMVEQISPTSRGHPPTLGGRWWMGACVEWLASRRTSEEWRRRVSPRWDG